ncbi:hypothetical protein SAMN06265375_1056 [Muriicola jejuensis]|nr:hypothetical protein SAMN06265375_1056 [Muriicola jejuensis]
MNSTGFFVREKNPFSFYYNALTFCANPLKRFIQILLVKRPLLHRLHCFQWIFFAQSSPMVRYAFPSGLDSPYSRRKILGLGNSRATHFYQQFRTRL